ncbi:MAG: hypothetical protein RRZ69_07430 [Clostridia bacterium]
MEECFIYEIGEAVATEIEKVKEVKYPQGQENPCEFDILLLDGKTFKLTLTLVE